MAEKMLDATGLSSALAVVKARKTLRDMAPKQTLEVLASDPAAIQEMREFCETSGHVLLDASTIEGNIYRFVIKNAG
jgi:tRNA 2-thiouridine synthesizing protein A